MTLAVTTRGDLSFRRFNAYLHYGIVNPFDSEWLKDEVVSKFFCEGDFKLFEDREHADFFVTYRKDHPDYVEFVPEVVTETEKEEVSTSTETEVTEEEETTETTETVEEVTTSTEETEADPETETTEGEATSYIKPARIVKRR